MVVTTSQIVLMPLAHQRSWFVVKVFFLLLLFKVLPLSCTGHQHIREYRENQTYIKKIFIS